MFIIKHAGKSSLKNAEKLIRSLFDRDINEAKKVLLIPSDKLDLFKENMKLNNTVTIIDTGWGSVPRESTDYGILNEIAIHNLARNQSSDFVIGAAKKGFFIPISSLPTEIENFSYDLKTFQKINKKIEKRELKRAEWIKSEEEPQAPKKLILKDLLEKESLDMHKWSDWISLTKDYSIHLLVTTDSNGKYLFFKKRSVRLPHKRASFEIMSKEFKKISKMKISDFRESIDFDLLNVFSKKILEKKLKSSYANTKIVHLVPELDSLLEDSSATLLSSLNSTSTKVAKMERPLRKLSPVAATQLLSSGKIPFALELKLNNEMILIKGAPVTIEKKVKTIDENGNEVVSIITSKDKCFIAYPLEKKGDAKIY